MSRPGIPRRLLVVDESYIDFLADPAPITLIGCGLGNVIVLRSPSKFFGLAGVRSGAAWSLHPLPASGGRSRTSWPVSAFAATALQTALADSSWAASTRQLLAGDAAWLDRGAGAVRAGHHARDACISGCSPGPAAAHHQIRRSA